MEENTKPIFASNQELLKYVSEIPTPFHLYDESTIRKVCKEFKAAFSWAPGFTNYFAVKATPNPHILRIIKEEGFGVDCSSLAELVLSEISGFSGEEIFFTSNNTPLNEFKKAKELGAIMNLDDISHIDFVHESIGLPNFICFRYNPGGLRSGNEIIGNPKFSKFGLTRKQIIEAFIKAKALGVQRFALHTMIISNRIGITYRPEETPLDLKALSKHLKRLYDRIIKPSGLDPLKIVFECGRSITGPAGCIISKIIHQKDTHKQFIGIDACMANLMRPALYNAYHHITVINNDNPSEKRKLQFTKESKGPAGIYDVVGSLCENNDKFACDRYLGTDFFIGDILVIHDTGAHGHSMGFNYNGKLRSAEFLRDKHGHLKQIRRAETLDDLFATLDFKIN